MAADACGGGGQMEASYVNNRSRQMADMENALRQVQQEFELMDAERRDLLHFQARNKKLTWVPDEAVAFCLGDACGHKVR